MAVGYSDNRFDWCDELIEVKRNYSNDECCNIIKNVIKSQKGADPSFVKEICSKDNASFKFGWYFFPVYSTNFRVTYNWDEEETKNKGDYKVTTTTHNTNTNTFNRDFYKSIYNSCCPNLYVGRNDDRFYKLSHVDDLDGNIYSAASVYSQFALKEAMENYAKSEKPAIGASYLINGWSVMVFFVPMVNILYEFGGKTYNAVVNMHNGRCYVNYVVSKAVEEKSKKTFLASVIMKSASILLSLVCFLAVMYNGFWAVLFSLGLIGGNIGATIATKHNKKYFYNEYGSKGIDIGLKVLKSEIIQAVVTLILMILIIIIF